MRTARPLLFAVIFLSAIGCGGDPVSDAIGAAVARGPGTRLALSEHTSFVWDRVCIFAPYTPDDKVDALTGIPAAAARAHDIDSNDGINVLMFLDRGEVIESVALSRGRADFGPELAGRCYSKEQAVFLVRTTPSGTHGNIGPR